MIVVVVPHAHVHPLEEKKHAFDQPSQILTRVEIEFEIDLLLYDTEGRDNDPSTTDDVVVHTKDISRAGTGPKGKTSKTPVETTSLQSGKDRARPEYRPPQEQREEVWMEVFAFVFFKYCS